MEASWKSYETPVALKGNVYVSTYGQTKVHSYLRVRPRTSGGIAELSQHEPDRCQAQESEGLVVQVLPILC
jgi:hypothetical protein